MRWYEDAEPEFYAPGTEPKSGDILTVKRHKVVYTHYGIYVGNDRVVHFSGPVGDDIVGKDTRIRNTALKDFLRGDPLRIQVIDEKHRRYSPEETVKRALSCVGRDEVVGGKYNFMLNNCEHFATWCVYGAGMTHQVHELGETAMKAQLAITEAAIGIAKFARQMRFEKKEKKRAAEAASKTENAGNAIAESKPSERRRLGRKKG